jgi:hypothetical protein
MVDITTGDMQHPPSGAIGSGESLTGAGELHKGEAVEQEASNFVTSFVAIAVKSTAGAQESNSMQEDKGVLDNLTPDPGDLALQSADAQSAVHGEEPEHDQTKRPIEVMMWEKMRPGMHILAELTDTYVLFMYPARRVESDEGLMTGGRDSRMLFLRHLLSLSMQHVSNWRRSKLPSSSSSPWFLQLLSSRVSPSSLA